MNLAELTRPDLVLPRLSGGDGSGVLRAFADRIHELGLVPDAGELHQKLREREELGSTGIGHGVAIPHCKLKGLDRPVLAVGVTQEGVDFGAADGQPVKLFFVVVSPNESPAQHLQMLAAISRWVKADEHVSRILRDPDRERILELLRSENAGP